jgi:small subunit ribosomal protein S9
MPKTKTEKKDKKVSEKTGAEKTIEVEKAVPSEKKKEVKTDQKSEEKLSCYQAVGRRKQASARVKLLVVAGDDITIKGITLKKGDIIVNGRPIEQYFPGEANKKNYLEIFRTTNTIGRFAVSALIVGGGSYGQLGAFMLGVARALEKVDKEKFRPIMKKRGFLMRDPRKKERRKAGFAQKARARKQSPKR